MAYFTGQVNISIQVLPLGALLILFYNNAFLEEFYQRFEGLCNVLLDNLHMFGYCYTQLTDVYQEQNGIYTFERNEKYHDQSLNRYVAYKIDAPGTNLSYYESGDADIVYPSLVDLEEIRFYDES
mgnify:CR=1 FL=1